MILIQLIIYSISNINNFENTYVFPKKLQLQSFMSN